MNVLYEMNYYGLGIGLETIDYGLQTNMVVFTLYESGFASETPL